MPAFKDVDTKTGKVKSWFVKFYYTDWQGNKVQKKKRGFGTQREALAYERDFLEKLATTPTTTFKALCENYLEDIAHRVKVTTFRSKEKIFTAHLIPAFGELPVSEITPATVRKWQQSLLASDYTPTYLHTIHAQLSAVFNYAMDFYNLPSNPARRAGSIGAAKSKRRVYWTVEQYQAFLLTLRKPIHIALYTLLFWSGMRIGEALALTVEDIDLENDTVTVSKTYVKIKGVPMLQPPKTSSSNRTIPLPGFIMDILADFIDYTGAAGSNRLFEGLELTGAEKALREHAILAGLEPIHIHDLRHSHASLLANLDVNPLVIKERLGHTNIATTMDIYSHLFPDKQKEVIAKINTL